MTEKNEKWPKDNVLSHLVLFRIIILSILINTNDDKRSITTQSQGKVCIT